MNDYSNNEGIYSGLSESRYTYEPAMTSISIKHVKGVYIACEKAQITKIPKSEICLNASTFSLGAASIIGMFQYYSLVWIIFGLAVALYLLYFLARKEEGENINNIANEIMRLMPLSEEEIDLAINNDQRIREARITSYIKHAQSPY